MVYAIVAVIALALGVAAGYLYRKNAMEKKLGQTEEVARNLLEDATRKAEERKKEALLEAKEEIIRLKSDLDKEVRDRRSEVTRLERRVNQREEQFDKKLDNLETREEALNGRYKEVERLEAEANEMHERQQGELERIAGMTSEEAKNILVDRIQKDAYHDAAVMVREIETRAKEEADKKARSLIALAIQKCAADHVAETTVSVVALPNDDMKGRIIGREGRNIRTLEIATGVDLIIDDTPEAVIISAFDPVRREVARIALEKLITDGRIHPARIEEMVEKAAQGSGSADPRSRRTGRYSKRTCTAFIPSWLSCLGRMRFRTSYGQNVLRHSIEVSHLAGVMAAELGADVAAGQARGSSARHRQGDRPRGRGHARDDRRGSCQEVPRERSGDQLRSGAHHGDVEPKCVEAVLVQAADAISAARPGARRESLENYIKRLEKLESIAYSFDGVETCYAIQSGREVRIIVKPEDVNDAGTLVLAARNREANREGNGVSGTDQGQRHSRNPFRRICKVKSIYGAFRESGALLFAESGTFFRQISSK